MPPSSPNTACVGACSCSTALIASSACLSASVTGLASDLDSTSRGDLSQCCCRPLGAANLTVCRSDLSAQGCHKCDQLVHLKYFVVTLAAASASRCASATKSSGTPDCCCCASIAAACPATVILKACRRDLDGFERLASCCPGAPPAMGLPNASLHAIMILSNNDIAH